MPVARPRNAQIVAPKFTKISACESINQCPECGSTKPRDVAAAQVICTRGQRGIENACGVKAAGAEVTQSSWRAVKQEIFGATQGISQHTH